MSVPPVWIFPVAVAAWCALLSGRIFRPLADDRPGRLASLDGLRGILALGVFGHHFAVTAQWQDTGRWALTPSAPWNLMGQGAVTVFFMITGFLFFGRIADGSRSFDTVQFLKSRLLRIYPVYVVAVAAAVGICAIGAAGRVGTAGSFVQDVSAWLLFDPGRLFGDADAPMIVAGVPWSLRYEWCFYLALPGVRAFWRLCGYRPWFVVALGVASLPLVQWPVAWPLLDVHSRFLAPFLLGGTASLIPRDHRWVAAARGWPGAALGLAALLAFLLTQATAYDWLAYLLLFGVFVPVALGQAGLGWLTSRPLQILGAASFDIYMLHGIVLFVLFHVAWPQALVAAGGVGLMLQLIGTGLVVIMVSLAVHRLVEKPAMQADLRLKGFDPRERLAAP